MPTIANGRYEMPENLMYSKKQHVYVDKARKIMGLDQIGFAFLKEPRELKILVDSEVKIGEPFAVIATGSGITTLHSICSGKIKSVNSKALSEMENDAYSTGFLIEFEEITKIQDSGLITGEEVEAWANHEVRSLLYGIYSFKVVEVGDSATGKTAIKVRFTDDFFKKDLKTTLGVDFGSKELKISYTNDDIMFAGTYEFMAKMNVWDAAGQAHYEKIRGMYYRDAKGALLVYDVNNPVSFENLDKWVEELEENVGRRIPTLLIGNKTDLEQKVPIEKAKEYAEKNGFLFSTTSAKTGEGVNEAFKQLAIQIYRKEEGI